MGEFIYVTVSFQHVLDQSSPKKVCGHLRIGRLISKIKSNPLCISLIYFETEGLVSTVTLPSWLNANLNIHVNIELAFINSIFFFLIIFIVLKSVYRLIITVYSIARTKIALT